MTEAKWPEMYLFLIMKCCNYYLKPAILLFIFTFLRFNSGFAQPKACIYLKNFVRHTDGDFCYHTAPMATFTVYINNDQSKVIIENFRCSDVGGDPNVAGNGTFGVELGNFIDPALVAGDNVSVGFTCNATD